jgi:parallel beta-helix repeat protein
MKNSLVSNETAGLSVLSGTKNNTIMSNEFAGSGAFQDLGVSLNGTQHKIYRNAIRSCRTNGVRVINGNGHLLVNNVVYGSLYSSGVVWQNTSSGTMINNILLSNGSGAGDYGLDVRTSGKVASINNDFYGNSAGNTNQTSGGLVFGTGNKFTDPMLETASGCFITSVWSAGVDSGLVYPGVSASYYGEAPDMGWRESLFTTNNLGPYYVDDDSGNDSSKGDFSHPFRTIGKAVGSMSAGAPRCAFPVTYVFPGVYNERISIRSNCNSGLMVLTRLSNDMPQLRAIGPMDYGLKITNSGHIYMEGFVVSGARSGTGILIEGNSSSNWIVNNLFISNAQSGVCLNGGAVGLTSILSNVFQGPGQTNGVNIRSGSMNQVIWNRFARLELDGVNIDSPNNTVSFNLCTRQGGSGIRLVGNASGNVIAGNTCVSNMRNGICLDGDGVDRNLVFSNVTGYAPQSVGVCISNGDQNEVLNNRLVRNTNAGIRIQGTGASNLVFLNSSFSNLGGTLAAGASLQGLSSFNSLWSNQFDGNDCGVLVIDASLNEIRMNGFRMNRNGLMMMNPGGGFSGSNRISLNDFANNRCGLEICLGADSGVVVSNTFRNNDSGPPAVQALIQAGRGILFARNLVVRGQEGLRIGGVTAATDCRVINNTFFKNLAGAVIIDNLSSATLANNIFLSNETVGVKVGGGSIASVRNNCYYPPEVPSTNALTGNIMWGPGNLFTNPGLDTQDSFGIIDPDSLVVDTGQAYEGVSENFYGYNPDMGVKESLFDALTVLWCQVRVSHISDPYSFNKPRPGSLVEYRVQAGNRAGGPADNVMIYNRFSTNFSYHSNSLSMVSGWTAQFSTNLDPDPSWDSGDFCSVCPPALNNVKIIRWKKASLNNLETAEITFTVKIK